MILQEKRNWLKAADLKTGDTIKFLNEGEIVENTKYTNPDGTPQKSLVFLVEYNGGERALTINSTNKKALIDGFGRDTVNWVGREAMVEKIKMSVAGAVKDTALLTPVIQQ